MASRRPRSASLKHDEALQLLLKEIRIEGADNGIRTGGAATVGVVQISGLRS